MIGCISGNLVTVDGNVVTAEPPRAVSFYHLSESVKLVLERLTDLLLMVLSICVMNLSSSHRVTATLLFVGIVDPGA